MLTNLLKNKTKLVKLIFLVGVLIAIRAFEDTIFYDPFLNYFKENYSTTPIPHFNPIKLFLSLGFRYYLNMLASLGILYLLFEDSKTIKFSMFLYAVLGTILLVSFFFVLQFFAEESKMTLFYIRRFIIQPILLILFIPAFFYQKKVK